MAKFIFFMLRFRFFCPFVSCDFGLAFLGSSFDFAVYLLDRK